MVKYNEIEGDIVQLALQGEFDAIAQGCNCQQMMGAGLAAQIKHFIPKAAQVDREDTRMPIQRLGDFTYHNFNTKDWKSVYIYNLYTQFQGGPDLSMDALRLCLHKLNFQCKGKHVGLPLIGCGIAGGKWSEVEALIKEYLTDVAEITIVHFKPS